ncbi:hypothetical protein [Streptomyces sp. NPDC096068]|uniref:hypothetical protein n=1 Tax=Streptomyces sp. NPDC096068 TaxID=3155424 RepID=UPI0033221D8D
MARLQILELPESAGDDRPPFILVIDKAPADGPLFQALRDDMELNEYITDKIGARATLVFEEVVEIPANDQFEERLAEVRPAANRLLPVRREVDQMDRITDALGLDRLRNWDEIVRAIEDARRTKRDGPPGRS